MNRRQFLLAATAVAAGGCGRGPVPFGGSPQAPNTDAERIREDLDWRAKYARVRGRDWVSPGARRTVPPAFDFAAAVPELAARKRTAVLLHPRYSDEPAADGSKVGGTLLWPAAEPWPRCDAHPGLRLVPVLQLRADEFPEVGFPPGKDLLQVLWCPREHERCWARPSLFWRKLGGVKNPLPAMPAEPAAYPRYVPLPCRLFPQRVAELPSGHELGALLKKLDDWNERERKFPGKKMEDLYCEATPYRGWKVGGWPNWVQGPEAPACKCGLPMELLLSFEYEPRTVSRAPTQEHHLYPAAGRRDRAAVENASNAPLVYFTGEGGQLTFICRRCPGWPVETISQC